MIIFALLFLYPWQPVIEQQRAQSGACLSGKRDRKTSFVMLRFQKKKKLHRSRICELCGFSSRSVSVCQERAHENNLTAERRFWAAFYLFDRELMPTFSFFSACLQETQALYYFQMKSVARNTWLDRRSEVR